MKITSEKLMTPAEVADLLNVRARILRKWRGNVVGPRWVKVGDAPNSLVRYLPDSVREFAGLEGG